MKNSIDIVKVRKDTPGCTDKIFLNSAGASLMTNGVLSIMKSYLEKEVLLGGYQTTPLFQDEINDFYQQASLLLYCKPENIAFVYNATDGYSKAVASLPLDAGDYILTTDDDYISNYILFFSLQKKLGIQIVRGNNLTTGDLDLVDFEHKIQQYKPKLVSVTHIPTNSGKIQPVEMIGNLCEKYNIWYIVDACQSVGQMDIDVRKIKCDFLSATGRKFLRGPRGTGLLYVSDKALHAGLEPLLIDMRGAEWYSENQYKPIDTAKRFELWESNQANILGLKEAIKYALGVGLENISQYNSGLSSLLKHLLMEIPQIQLTEEGSKSGSIVTFTSKIRNQTEIQSLLNEAGISYSTSYRHFALIDFNKKNVDWVIRFSPHYFNIEEEIKNVAKVLQIELEHK